jgi:predicted dehydrogenase
MIAVESDVRVNLADARKAIDAGKHIHLDKPPGQSLSELRALLDDTDRKNLIVQMGYMFRYNTGFDLIRQAMREGWLGDVYYVHGNISSDIRPDGRKRLAFHPGGMMYELACHLIDVLVLLLGRPHKVTPFLRHDATHDDGLADNTLAVFEFDRTMAVIETAAMETSAFARRQFEVCGTNGSIVLQPLEPPAVRLCLREPRGGYVAGWQTVDVPTVPRYARDLEEFARCIRGEQEFPYSIEHDFTAQETLLRACGVGKSSS